MLNCFISTSAALRPLDIGTAVFSVVAHAGLIAFAVTNSGRPATAGTEPAHIAVEHVHFIDARSRVEMSDKKVKARKGGKAAQRAAVDPLAVVAGITPPLIAPVSIPTTIPDVDYTSVATEAVSFGNTSESLARTVIGPANAVLGPGNAYSENVVEKTVWPRRGNPTPRYPGMLERAGVEGRLLVRFVVDSTGKVDPKQMEFPATAERGFVESIKYALLHSRYFPAELGGIRVRQLVQQEFVFLLQRR